MEDVLSLLIMNLEKATTITENAISFFKVSLYPALDYLSSRPYHKSSIKPQEAHLF